MATGVAISSPIIQLGRLGEVPFSRELQQTSPSGNRIRILWITGRHPKHWTTVEERWFLGYEAEVLLTFILVFYVNNFLQVPTE